MAEHTIPHITDERLAELVDAIKPVQVVGTQYQQIAPVDPRRTAFTWEVNLIGPLLTLAPLQIVHTYHRWNYYGMFKPSLAEVFACIQDRAGDTTHFWLNVGSVQEPNEPLLHRGDVDCTDGYHRACVLLLKELADG